MFGKKDDSSILFYIIKIHRIRCSKEKDKICYANDDDLKRSQVKKYNFLLI